MILHQQLKQKKIILLLSYDILYDEKNRKRNNGMYLNKIIMTD